MKKHRKSKQAGRVDEVRPGHVRKHVAALKEARRLIKSLLALAEQ